jgi:hypothetical protein
MNDIIPFGKYRGQEIEQIRQRDPAYLQWLVQQAWFSEKFGPTYQLVVNNFAPPSEETPAHNALQVRFLEFKFQIAFWYGSGLDDAVDWKDLAVRFNTRIESSGLRKAPKPRRRGDDRKSGYAHAPEKYWVESHQRDVRQKWKTWRLRNREPVRQRAFGSAKFEDITDVCFGLTASVGFGEINREFDATDEYQIYIEIKPSMGDDYPAVLRQVKRQQQVRKERAWSRSFWCLLVDQFASQSVTLEQVRRIFLRDAILVVEMQDVRDELIKRGGD